MLQIKIYKIELPSTDDLFIQSLNSRHTSKLCYSLIKFSILLLVPDEHGRLPLGAIEAEVGPASPDPLPAVQWYSAGQSWVERSTCTPQCR